VRNDLNHINFIRLWDLLGHDGQQQNEKGSSKAYYARRASCIRRELMYRYGDPGFDVDLAIESDKDWAMTYSTYIEVLTKDFAGRDNEDQSLSPEIVAKRMITRGKAYAEALQATREDYVRLSIHDSVGKGKLSIALIPHERGSVGLMPWRSSVAIDADGSYRTIFPDEVRDTHELVSKNGQPYFFRIKSDLFDWSSYGLEVDIEHLYPCGLIIRPVRGKSSHPTSSIRSIPMQKVRHVSHHFAPVVLRGFRGSTIEELYIEKAHELGKVLTWALTGTIFKVKDTGDVNKNANNVTSNEPLPMHFDGIFKFEDREDLETGEIKKVLSPPGYQFFACLSTAPKGSGYTLFCNSRLFFRYLPAP
jgi:hypothetical protein